MLTPEMLGLTKLAYTLKETMDLLSIRRTKLYDEAKAGKLKLLKIGGKTVFMAIDIAEYLSNIRGDC